jgi:hypothetical protein
VNRNRLLDLRISPFEVADHLAVDEIRLLRAISSGDLVERGGTALVSRIDEVLRLLSSRVAGLDTKFHLVMQLGARTVLADAIRQASQQEIEADDSNSQLEFVLGDLSEAPLLMLIKPRLAGEEPRLVLRGHQLLYALRQYRQPIRTSAVSTTSTTRYSVVGICLVRQHRTARSGTSESYQLDLHRSYLA